MIEIERCFRLKLVTGVALQVEGDVGTVTVAQVVMAAVPADGAGL